MTRPEQEQPDDASVNPRAMLVLVFLLVALWNVVLFVWGFDWDWDKLVIAGLFVAIAAMTRTIGVYRQRLGLEK